MTKKVERLRAARNKQLPTRAIHRYNPFCHQSNTRSATACVPPYARFFTAFSPEIPRIAPAPRASSLYTSLYTKVCPPFFYSTGQSFQPFAFILSDRFIHPFSVTPTTVVGPNSKNTYRRRRGRRRRRRGVPGGIYVYIDYIYIYGSSAESHLRKNAPSGDGGGLRPTRHMPLRVMGAAGDPRCARPAGLLAYAPSGDGDGPVCLHDFH